MGGRENLSIEAHHSKGAIGRLKRVEKMIFYYPNSKGVES